jgi:hypothetical protein
LEDAARAGAISASFAKFAPPKGLARHKKLREASCGGSIFNASRRISPLDPTPAKKREFRFRHVGKL